MVKNKATSRLLHIPGLVSFFLSLSLPLADLALSRPVLHVSLSNAVHPEGSPGSFRGWTLAVNVNDTERILKAAREKQRVT